MKNARMIFSLLNLIKAKVAKNDSAFLRANVSSPNISIK